MKARFAIELGALLMVLAWAMWHGQSGQRHGPGEWEVSGTAPSSAAAAMQPVESPPARLEQALGPIDPVLIAALEKETDPERRSAALDRAVGSVAEADFPAAVEALMHSARPAAIELLHLLARRWAEKDPAAAAAWIARFPEALHYRAAAGQAAIAWANSDLRAAQEWWAGLPEGESKEAVALDLAYEAARTEPVTALGMAAALPATSARNDLLVHAFSQWAGGDFAAAVGWAEQVPDVSLRQRLLAAGAIARAKQDGPAAAQLAASALDPGEEQDRAAVAIVQRWAQSAPQATAAWVAQDAEGALGWLQQLPPGRLRDLGFLTYRETLPPTDGTPEPAPAASP